MSARGQTRSSDYSMFSNVIPSFLLAKDYVVPDNTRPANFTDLAIAKTTGLVTFANTIPAFLLAKDYVVPVTPPTEKQIWEYTNRTTSDAGASLTAIPKLDVATSTLATAANLALVPKANWEYDISLISGVGLAGTYLKAAGAAGDPWAVKLGGYGAGSAGYIFYTNLDAQVSKAMLATTYVAPDNTTLAKFLTMISASGANWTFTPDALKNAAGTADWSTAERSQIRKALGITGTSAATTGKGVLDELLELIQAKGGH